MSYILDALKRADAERGVVTRSTPADPHGGAHRRSPARLPGWAAALALALFLCAIVGWWFWPAPAALVPAQSVGGPELQHPTAPPPPARATPTARPTLAPEAEPPAGPLLAPAPAVRSSVKIPQPDTDQAPRPRPSAAAPGETITTAAPPEVRITGATYSENAALRMLIANGKVVQEGQDIAPGLRLEVIGPHSAVLNHQGRRYNLNY
jgi:general secretion pathway protein B